MNLNNSIRKSRRRLMAAMLFNLGFAAGAVELLTLKEAIRIIA